VASTGTGPGAAAITINGSGGQGTTDNFGVAIDGSPAPGLVTSLDGPITVTGSAGSGPVNESLGVVVLSGGVVLSQSGTVTLNGPDPVLSAFTGPGQAQRTAALAGLDAQERFVQALYLVELGRAGSKPELDGWVSFLVSPGGSQAAVAATISASPEARDHLVRSWYVNFLGRQAQGGEEQPFVAMLLAGQTEEQALSVLLGSEEFFGRSQVLTTSGTPQERYTQTLYQLLLNRPAGADEVAGWVAVLSAGLSRQQMALYFLQSQEFHTDQFQGYYMVLLHRLPSIDPTSEEQSFITSLLLANMDVHAARNVFESSSEFFTNG
jgi:hypothetical protein